MQSKCLQIRWGRIGVWDNELAGPYMGGAWCWCMACAWMYGGGDVGDVGDFVWGVE